MRVLTLRSTLQSVIDAWGGRRLARLRAVRRRACSHSGFSFDSRLSFFALVCDAASLVYLGSPQMAYRLDRIVKLVVLLLQLRELVLAAAVLVILLLLLFLAAVVNFDRNFWVRRPTPRVRNFELARVSIRGRGH